MEHVNSTSMPDYASYHRFPIFNVLGSLTSVLIALAAISGNLAVVIASFWDEALRVQTGNILIVYLSMTDILTAAFVMLPSSLAVGLDRWPLGWVACRLNAFFNYMFACSSSFNIALISVDRAIAITFPLQYRNIVTDKLMLVFMGWLFVLGSAIGAVGGLLKWSRYDYSEGVCAMDYNDSDTSGVFYFFTGAGVVCYFVPVAIISVCYATIIHTANRSGKKATRPVFVRRDEALTNVIRKGQSDSHMKKTIKSMVVVVMTYYICFSPYSFLKLIKVYSGMDTPPWVNYGATLSIFVASATNPFIYAILRKDYRDAFKKLPKMVADRCHFSHKF